jgi:hypothetical protein
VVHRRNSRLDSSAAVALEHVLMGAHALGARAFHALIRSDPLRLRLEKSHLTAVFTSTEPRPGSHSDQTIQQRQQE